MEREEAAEISSVTFRQGSAFCLSYEVKNKANFNKTFRERISPGNRTAELGLQSRLALGQ